MKGLLDPAKKERPMAEEPSGKYKVLIVQGPDR